MSVIDPQKRRQSDRDVIGYNPDDIDWQAGYNTAPGYEWDEMKGDLKAMWLGALLVMGVTTMGLVSLTILVAFLFKLWRVILG